jgi:hypothetical protein
MAPRERGGEQDRVASIGVQPPVRVVREPRATERRTALQRVCTELEDVKVTLPDHAASSFPAELQPGPWRGLPRMV